MPPLQPSTPIPLVRLAALAEIAELRLALPEGDDPADGAPCIVRARAFDDDVEIGWLPLEGRHPADELLGLSAPPDWSAIGVATLGWAHHLDDRPAGAPGGPPERIRVRTVHLVGRDGAWAARWQPVDAAAGEGASDTGTADHAGRPVGRIDDVCRRVLRLPTSPPPESTALLWATQWLDAIVDHAGRVEPPATVDWPTVAALHPAVPALCSGPTTAGEDRTPATLAHMASQLASWRDWPLLRRSCAAGTWSIPAIDGELADWFDDGSFARWLLDLYPTVDELEAIVADLLPTRVTAAVRATLAASGIGVHVR